MATRGCVAIRQDDKKWLGVYNHWSSYPSGLGKWLWDVLHQMYAKDGEILKTDLEKFAKELLEYDDWRNFLNNGICEYCGKKGFGQPHSISGILLGNDFLSRKFKTKEEMIKYFKSLPNWKGKNKKILKIVEEQWKIKENVDKTGYPDPECKYHKHGKLNDKITPKNWKKYWIEWIYLINPKNSRMEILYDGELIETIDLNKPEPNWEEIQENFIKGRLSN